MSRRKKKGISDNQSQENQSEESIPFSTVEEMEPEMEPEIEFSLQEVEVDKSASGKKVQELESQVKGLVERVGAVESRVKTGGGVPELESQVKGLVERVGAVESRVKTGGGVSELESQVKGLVERVGAVESRVKTGGGVSSELESQVKGLVERVGAVESRMKTGGGVAELESQVKGLVERVGAVESELKARPLPSDVEHEPDQKEKEQESFTSLPFYFKTIKTSATINFNLETLLKVMIKHKASDLHIKPGVRPVVRLEGELIPVGNTVLQEADTQKLILDSMPEPVLKRFYQQGYADYAYALPEGRFRVNAYLQRAAVSAAIRYLKSDIPSFKELNLPDVLNRFVEFNHGLILVTGPAGNGKSTTLASMIHQINMTQKKHIITIEDPIEFVHQDEKSFISQREIGSDAPSFFDALKQALRQDPNVILIGEMRDPETIWTAVMAAETGHLVLSTLHTPNTVQSIDRILDPFSGEQQKQFRELLARTLRAVVSQRLLPKADGSGRVPAVEVMISTPTIASLIAEGNTSEIYTYIAQGEHEGMQTFTESLTKLYQAGMVSKETALFHAEHQTEFRLGIEGHFTGAPSRID